MMIPLYAAYRETLALRQKLYEDTIATGSVTPFIYPWDCLPAIYLFFGVALRSRISDRYARAFNVSVFLLILGHGIYIVTHRRTVGMVSGYGIGLSMMWGFIMSGVLLLVNDCSKNYARLEWRELELANGLNGESIHSQTTVSDKPTGLRQRHNGHIDKQPVQPDQPERKERRRLVWQTLPRNPIHCIDWTLDLMTSFRGPNWNFRNPTASPINAPKLEESNVEITRAIKTDGSASQFSASSTISERAFNLQSIRNTIFLYLFLDVLKAIMVTDPYFLGLAPADSPHPWKLIHLAHQLTNLPLLFLVRLTRLLITLPAVIAALSIIFSLCPLFFYMVLPYFIDPKKITYIPLKEQWLYPSFFSPIFPTIADKGLAGLWGKCWHQMFRNGISEPSKPLLENLQIDPRSQAGKAIQSFIAFGLSGMIHALASYTTLSIIPSKPWMPFIFFTLQAVGIIFQQAVSDFIMKRLKLNPPKLVRQATNVAFVFVWGYNVGPILADDFAKCGVWLFEPLPVSFVRGFMGEGWWRWQGLGDWIGFWKGVDGNARIWDTGLALL